MLWKLRLHALDDPLSSPLRRGRVQRGEVFAYLAGIVDGDGYLKVTRNYRTPGTVHPYYASVVGVQQFCGQVRLLVSSQPFLGAP